jgi:hypothetical protein
MVGARGSEGAEVLRASLQFRVLSMRERLRAPFSYSYPQSRVAMRFECGPEARRNPEGPRHLLRGDPSFRLKNVFTWDDAHPWAKYANCTTTQRSSLTSSTAGLTIRSESLLTVPSLTKVGRGIPIGGWP